MRLLTLILIAGLAVAVVILLATRWASFHHIEEVTENLLSTRGKETFSTEALMGLPEPAQRYLRHAISPGTPLASAVRLSMRGTFLLRRGGERMPMSAEEVLAPPRGFVWKAQLGSGFMRFGGFDAHLAGEGQMRWWLWDLVPLVRAQGGGVSRSAAGRLALESLLLPSALLPQRGARWQEGEHDTVSVSLDIDGEDFQIRLSLDSDGRLLRAQTPRWGDPFGDGRFGTLPFEVEAEQERAFEGYTIPARIKVGWRLRDGTFHDFFHAEILEAHYR